MFWAAEIFIDGNDFYLSYSASPDYVMQNHRIGIAKSSSIYGPYIYMKNEPTFDLGVETIDQHLFKHDGIVYMLYTNHHEIDAIYMVPLNETMTGTAGAHVKLFERMDGETVCEAPWMWIRDGRYYILYSANGGNTVDYRVGYYYAPTLKGPYSFGGYILSKSRDLLGSEVWGPGHCSVVQSPSGSDHFIVYQSKKNSDVNWERYVSIDRISCLSATLLRVRGPSTTYQPIPA